MDTSDILGYSYETIDRIVRFMDNHDLPPVPMLASALQESNLNLYAAGDLSIGGSYGVYQIYTQAHGGPPERWQGLDGLDASMNEMVGRWHQTFTDCGGWQAVVDDLIGFQLAFAPAAQGSIGWDDSMARARISKAVALYSLYLKRQAA